MNWLKRHLTEIFCVLFLTALVGVVAVQNYTSGTFLTGIDNFHIEFDPGLALSRAWSGVWQENQGEGIVSGLAQMTELPRVAIYQVLSWVMPTNLIRYAYVFGNLYLGVIGVFFLMWHLSKSRLAGLAGALFYLFNLGTLQVFFMPTDMFVVNYAALPWLFLLVFKYLGEGRRASLLWYSGLLLLFTPMAMTPTIFVVYLLFLGIICVGYKWKRVFGIVGVTLGMSMYFLLPFANFAMNNAKVLTESKVNSVFSQENYLMNAARTSWSDLVTLKGMWFDYPDNVNGQLVPLLGVWNSYLVSVGMWLYFPMIVIGIGVVVMLWMKKWQGIAVVVMGVVSLALLRGENPPVGGLVHWLRSLPLVAEAFRTPYTKIAPILTIVYAVCFGYGAYAIGQAWRFKMGKNVWKALIFGGAMVMLTWINLPFFQGRLISEGVRVKMPEEYFEMFKFFKNQDRYGRVVRLSAHSSQSWDYTNWGYRGSGFLWYGIEQPILDRAFDVWSPYNEGFYNEFSNAIYSCNPVRSDLVGSDNDLQPTRSDLGCGEQFAKVLEKYDVRYVLLDESVIAPGQGKEILRIEETKTLAQELGWERVFNENFLSVWEVPQNQSDTGPQFVSTPSSYTWVEGDTSKVRRDVIWEEYGHYVSAETKLNSDTVPQIVYPFAGLMREEVKGVEYGDGETIVSSTVPQLHSDTGMQIVIPGWKVGDIIRINYRDGEPLPAYTVNGQNGPVFRGKEESEEGRNYFTARVSEGEEWVEYLRSQEFGIRNQKIVIEAPGEAQIYDFGKAGAGTIGNCDVLKRGTATKSQPVRSDLVGSESDLQPTRSDLGSQGTSYIADGRGAVCDYILTGELDTRLSYLMRVQGENKEGRSLKFFLYNTGSKRNDIEYLLSKDKFDQTFSILPWTWDGTYTLNIETRSFGQYAENVVKPVEVRWLPLEQIAGMRITPKRSDLVGSENGLQPTRSDLRVAGVKKYGTWLYIVKIEGSGLLMLSQGYDEGWIAPPIKHVKVDGWANGWMIDHSGEITIFYWPQLLEYLGFTMLGATIWVVLKRN